MGMSPDAERMALEANIKSKRRELNAALQAVESAGDARSIAALKSIHAELSRLGDRRDALGPFTVSGRQTAEDSRADGYGTLAGMAPRHPEPIGAWGDAVLKSLASRGETGLRSVLGSAGDASIASAVGGPFEEPRQARFIADLMPAPDAPGGHVAYLQQTVRTNNAAVVAPGGVKPTSVYTLHRVDDTTDTVAHISEPVNASDLEDSAVLAQFIEQELRLGLSLAIDAEIVDALDAAGILVEGDIGTTLHTARRCITRLEERSVFPTAWVLNPRDWEEIENEASTTFAANANMAPATDAVKRTLFGIPVVTSMATPINTGYLGDFAGSSAVYRTGSVRIAWSEGHYDTGTGATDFERNLLRLRAEQRVLPAIFRTMAFIKVTLTAAGS